MSTLELDSEIISLKDVLEHLEAGDSYYLSDEMKELRHLVLFTHHRVEESLTGLLLLNQVEPLIGHQVPMDVVIKLAQLVKPLLVEINFHRLKEICASRGLIAQLDIKLIDNVNNLRNYFSHPAKFKKNIDEYRKDKQKYKMALEDLVELHKRLDVALKKMDK